MPKVSHLNNLSANLVCHSIVHPSGAILSLGRGKGVTIYGTGTLHHINDGPSANTRTVTHPTHV